MHKNLRSKINESIEARIISKNLLLICLACLHEKITFSELVQTKLVGQRLIIAKTAISNSVPKEDIERKIKTISKQDYPTLKTISSIADLCESNSYSYVDDFIPDRWIHCKTHEDIQADSLRKPVKKKLDIAKEELDELTSYIQKEVIDMPLSSDMIKSLKALRTKEYPYCVILKAFQLYRADIISATRKPFDSSYGKFKYILKIIENNLPDTVCRMKQQEKAKETTQTLDISTATHTGAEYQRKTKETPKNMEEYW